MGAEVPRKVMRPPASAAPELDPGALTTAGQPCRFSGDRTAGAERSDRPWLWLAFAAEVLIVDLYQMPTHLKFDAVAFGDHGLSLTAEYLIRSGYRPALDFSYPYGALSLLFGNAWFKFLG